MIVEGGRVVDRYQSLMNAGVRIPAYIEALTGISNAMIRTAPSAQDVMRAVSDFVGGIPIVAHNAAFDSKFWDAELARIQRSRKQDFICSLLLSRRIFPLAPSHKLGALIEYACLPVAGRYHRALADAEMAASSWCGSKRSCGSAIRCMTSPSSCCGGFSAYRKLSCTNVWRQGRTHDLLGAGVCRRGAIARSRNRASSGQAHTAIRQVRSST